jgi:phosphoserine phosphatase
MEQKNTCPQPRLLLDPPPLVLDLDGTLIRTDTFHEMMVHLLHHKPWMLLFLPFWFLKGRAYTKARLSQEVDLHPTTLPYNKALLTFAESEAQSGRSIILATGSPQKVAERIADSLGFFHAVIGSSDSLNMTGPHKQKALVDRFGLQGFDYAGDSCIDTHVWKVARKVIVVHPKWKVLSQAQALSNRKDITLFPRELHRPKAFLLALRPLFWICNLIAPSWSLFIALCFLTSGLFICDDLFSLYKERKGSFKKSIFAEGHLHLSTAFILGPLLVLPPLLFFPILLIYIPLFITADLLTRRLSQGLRWLILVLLQTLGLACCFL